MKKQALIVFTIAFMLLVPLSTLGTHTLEEQVPARDFIISDGEGWLEGFDFRQSLNITGSIGAGTDYQLMFDAYYDDDEETLTLHGNCQEDFDDVRFTDNDGITQLDYWTEHPPSGSEPFARFWVEVSDNLDSNQVIYIYYGNALVSSESDGDATFLFFDDFENNNLDRWDETGNLWSVETDEVKYGTYSAFGDGADGGAENWLTAYLDGFNTVDIMVHMWTQREVQTSAEYIFRSSVTDEGNVYAVMSSNDDWTYDNGPLEFWEESTFIDDTWFRVEIAFDYSNELYSLWINSVPKGDKDFEDRDGNDITNMDTWEIVCDAGAGEDIWIDDCYIRNYVLVEPSHSEWGEEEEVFREWHSFTMEQIQFDLPSWIGFSMENIIFYIPIGELNISYWLMLGGLVMIPTSTVLLVKGGRSDMSRDKLFLFLIMFLFGWSLFLGGIL